MYRELFRPGLVKYLRIYGAMVSFRRRIWPVWYFEKIFHAKAFSLGEYLGICKNIKCENIPPFLSYKSTPLFFWEAQSCLLGLLSRLRLKLSHCNSIVCHQTMFWTSFCSIDYLLFVNRMSASSTFAKLASPFMRTIFSEQIPVFITPGNRKCIL